MQQSSQARKRRYGPRYLPKTLSDLEVCAPAMQPSGVFGRIRCLGQQARAFATNAAPGETAITLPNGKQLIVDESDIILKMPAEFDLHAGCWLAWPKRPEIWRADGKPAKRAFTQVVNAISKFEPVTVIAHNAQVRWSRCNLMCPLCPCLLHRQHDGILHVPNPYLNLTPDH